MNKIDEIKARAAETMVQTRDMHWSLYDVLLNDIFWLIGQIERKDEALRFYADAKQYEQEECSFDAAGTDVYWEAPEIMQDLGQLAREAL